MLTADLPLFSVLIANYNNGEYLLEAIDSIIDQTYDNWEIVIVDDCSTDNSQQLYNELRLNSRIKIFINDKNRGCGYTKSKCVAEAKGELCGFLDPDDALAPQALEVMVQAHLRQLSASLVYSKNYLCDENLKITETNERVGPIAKSYVQNAPIKNSNIVSAFASFKRKLYQQTSGINPDLKRAVDQDLYYKLEETGHLHFINETLYFYRIHNRGISTLKNQHKARYWHIKVLEDAYKRRKDKFKDINITKSQLNKIKASYHYLKASEKYQAGEFAKMYGQILKSLLLDPQTDFRHKAKIFVSPFQFWK